MFEIKRIPLSAAAASDAWLDWEEENASDLLQHLQSDNLAFGRLRDALSSDVESVALPEGAPI